MTTPNDPTQGQQPPQPGGYGPPAGEYPPQGPPDPAAPPTGYQPPAGQYPPPQPGEFAPPPLAPPPPGPYGAPPQPGEFAPPGAYAPAPGQPYPAEYAPPGAYGTVPPGVPPQKKSYKGLWLSLIVIVVLAAGGVAAYFALKKDDKATATPEAAVKAYLTALANGDAPAALALALNPPPAGKFLTSDVLKQQQAKAKISGINVVKQPSLTSITGSTSVNATYTFGTRSVSEDFAVTKFGNQWKLEKVSVEISLSSSLNSIPGLTLFGQATKDLQSANVFPGPLLWASSNKNFTVKDSNADKWPASPQGYASTNLSAVLTDQAKKDITTAVSTYVTACTASKEVEPKSCPQQTYAYGAVAGSATWTLKSDLSKLKFQGDYENANKIDVSGSLNWSVTYQSKDYDGTVTNASDASVDGSVYGSVDLSVTPLVFTPTS